MHFVNAETLEGEKVVKTEVARGTGLLKNLHIMGLVPCPHSVILNKYKIVNPLPDTTLF